jgi:hypothetical protein
VDVLRKTTVKCKCGNEFILTSEDSDDNPVWGEEMLSCPKCGEELPDELTNWITEYIGTPEEGWKIGLIFD